jgi:xylulokinase
VSSYVIGIDIGTQGTKAALFNEEMELVTTAFEESRLISPKPGTVWQEPDDLYMSCARTIKELLEKSGISSADVAVIGIDGQMAGIMGIDERGQASTYFDSWLDTRCGGQMKEMRRHAGKRIIELSGGPVSYVHGPKILWWKQEHPEAYKNTAKFVLPQAYVVGRMTGLSGEEAYFDYTHLHFSSLADNANKKWSDELLEAFDIDKSKMARIVSPFDVMGKVTAEFAAISGLTEGVPVVAGCGDTAASTFGSGMFERGMILDCAGTASVLCSVVDSFVPDTEHETLTMMRSPVDGLFLPLAYINGGGMCIRW